MKKVIPICLLLVAFGCAAQKTFTIEGYMKGVPDGTAVTLVSTDALGQRAGRVQSKTVKDGRFTMSGAMPSDKEYMEIACGGVGRYIPLWIAEGETTVVKGDGLDVSDWVIESDIAEQEQENFFRQVGRPYETRMNIIDEEYDRINAKRRVLEDSIRAWNAAWGITDPRKNTAAQIDSINSDSKYLGASFRINALFEIEQAIQSFRAPASAKKRVDKLWIMKDQEVLQPWLREYYWNMLGFLPQLETNNSEVDHLPSTFRGDVIALYDRIPAAMLDTDLGRETARYYAALTGKNEDLIDGSKASGVVTVALVEVGGPMSDTDLFDLEGNVRHLSEFAGGYILLDFWAHWCGPCINAMPEMREISEQYKGKLMVVSISKDAEQLWRIASDQHNITWQNFNAGAVGDELWRAYRVNGIPHYVLIGPDGKVVEMWTGYVKGAIKEKLAGRL